MSLVASLYIIETGYHGRGPGSRLGNRTGPDVVGCGPHRSGGLALQIPYTLYTFLYLTVRRVFVSLNN